MNEALRHNQDDAQPPVQKGKCIEFTKINLPFDLCIDSCIHNHGRQDVCNEQTKCHTILSLNQKVNDPRYSGPVCTNKRYGSKYGC